MNWELFDLVEIAIDRGYKSIWVIYQAQAKKIPITLDDIKEIGEIYNHKPRWAIYTAQKFEIPPFDFRKRKQGSRRNGQSPEGENINDLDMRLVPNSHDSDYKDPEFRFFRPRSNTSHDEVFRQYL